MSKKLYASEYNQALLDSIGPLDNQLFNQELKIDSDENEKISTPSLNFLQDAWRRLKKNKGAMISLFVVIAIILLAVAAPVIAPHSPFQQNPSHSNLPPKIPGLEWFSWFDGKSVNRGGTLVDNYEQAGVPEGVYYYLGTDSLGRDLLSRILYGTRISLIVAFVAVLINLVFGIIYGLISGWFGGKVDTFMQRILEILSGIPNLVIVVLMLLVLKPGITSIIITIALTSWITMSRVVRAQTIRLKQEEYVQAARVLGQSTLKIMFKHLLPNMLGIIIVQVMFAIPSAIFFEAFLSFIGIGIPAPNASLGTLLNDGYQTFRFLPHLMWYPAAMISIIMLSFNLLADGLRDAFDPKMKV
ncbi:oligopeptide ABC transporter permease [Fundicoccus culcitae]|uniref:ABC transporter permease n=1 Tax=Fundicoccus culcitae TaxID=2969821 RepID=A0ABY5P6V8_9LACT|nr:oligopeptide ABC transporter permease [Fundicoccus culcitae]UUX34274.1 ABC transporter permease [Fundicoccus culcitae]